MPDWLKAWMRGLGMPAIILAWLGISAIAVVTGPFGSYHDMPFGLRALYWPVVVALSIVLGTLVRGFVELRLGLQDSWQALPLLILGHMLILALPIWGLARLFTRHRDILLPGPWAFVAYVGLTSLGVGVIRILRRQWLGLPATRPVQAWEGAESPGPAPPEITVPGPGLGPKAPTDRAPTDLSALPPGLAGVAGVLGQGPRTRAEARPRDAVLAQPLADGPADRPADGPADRPADGPADSPPGPVAAAAAPALPQPGGPPRLLERLPAGEWGDLVRISSDNHHVALHMQGGTARLLLRLADALAETAPQSGMQVHRSHWVAFAHIRGSARINGRPVLLLSDDSQVPISRSFLPEVQARGLITDS